MSNHACVVLPFPPTANNLFSGKARRFRSRAYKEWLAEADLAWLRQSVTPIHGPVTVTISLGRPDRRRRDCFNYEKAPIDFLVARGVIDDDSLIERGVIQWSDSVTGCMVEIEAYLPESEWPGWEDLRGRAPGATGDLSSEAFVRRLRDEWRRDGD